MASEESGVTMQDSRGSASIESQAATVTSLSTRPSTPPSPSSNANVSERDSLAQSRCVLSPLTSY